MMNSTGDQVGSAFKGHNSALDTSWQELLPTLHRQQQEISFYKEQFAKFDISGRKHRTVRVGSSLIDDIARLQEVTKLF